MRVGFLFISAASYLPNISNVVIIQTWGSQYFNPECDRMGENTVTTRIGTQLVEILQFK